MIELRVDLHDLIKVRNEVLFNITIIERMREAGIPVVGRLIPSGVTHGTLVYHTEEDLDGDTLLIRWYDRNEGALFTSMYGTGAFVKEDDEL